MSDYIRELETELIRAGRERQRRRARFSITHSVRIPRISFGGVVVALGTMIAIAVALVVLVLAGHHRPPQQAGASTKISAAARNVVAKLAVLRRPQTSADRAPAGLVRLFEAPLGGAGQTIVPGLTRLVATLPGGPTRPGQASQPERIFLIVATPGSPSHGRPTPFSRDGDLVFIAKVSTGAGTGFRGGLPAALLYRPQSMFPEGDGNYLTSIIPDGVTRVRWDFSGQPGTATRSPSTTIYPTIQNNLAVLPIVRNQGRVTQVTWYGAGSQIIRTATRPQPPVQIGSPCKLPSQPGPFFGCKPVAQINLRPPAGPPSRTAGVADVFKRGSTRGIKVLAQGLPPTTKHTAYAVWLYTSPVKSQLLGFVNPGVGANGRLITAGGLPPDATTYKTILITIETSHRPTAPGKIYLEGKARFR